MGEIVQAIIFVFLFLMVCILIYNFAFYYGKQYVLNKMHMIIETMTNYYNAKNTDETITNIDEEIVFNIYYNKGIIKGAQEVLLVYYKGESKDGIPEEDSDIRNILSNMSV